MKKEISVSKRYWSVLISCALMGGGTIIPLSYINYIYTDLAGVNYVSMSVALTIVSAVGLVFSLFSGMLIQKTKSKMGQYRPWVMWCSILMMAGVLISLTHVGSTSVVCVIITIGYLIWSLAGDTIGTAQFGVFERLSGGDNDARNKIYSGCIAGSNLGYTVYAVILLSLVQMIGGENETLGFFGAEVVIGVLSLVGLIILLKVSKNYDVDNTNATVTEEAQVGIKEMLKGIVGNKPIIAILAGELFKYIGYNMFTFLLVYQCVYVLGSLDMMTYALTGMSIICMLASFAAPKAIELFKGRKNTLIATALIGAASYITLAFVGDTTLGFFIPFVIASFADGMYMAISINCYLDAGEYWYDKTGKDTRAYIMSTQAIDNKIAMLFSTPILGVVLGMASYTEGVGITTVEGLSVMTRATGLLPGVGCLICALVLLLFHKVSDKEMEACVERNAAKDAELYGDMM